MCPIILAMLSIGIAASNVSVLNGMSCDVSNLWSADATSQVYGFKVGDKLVFGYRVGEYLVNPLSLSFC